MRYSLLIVLLILALESRTVLLNPVTTAPADGTNINSTESHTGSHVDNESSHNGTEGEEGEIVEKEEHGVELAAIRYDEIKGPLVITIVILIAGISKIGFHSADKLSSLLPESCLLIIVGILFGVIIHFSNVGSSLPQFFTPETFFQFLLPPIILESSFSLYDRTVTENIGSILIFAVVGTTVTCFLIGLSLYGLMMAGAMEFFEVSLIQLLVFSALIVAVDPVAVLAVFTEVGINNVLYFLVFGESLLNDGVTVVLYLVLQSYNRIQQAGGAITAAAIVLGIMKFFIVCLGGLAIGIIVGCLSAFFTKYTNTVKVIEPIAIFGMAYLSYLLAELFEFSGIICLIGCGLIQVAYAFQNITHKSKVAIKYFTKVLSTTSEIIIFLFLGLIIIRDHNWKTGFVLWTLFLCIVFRFIITFVFSALINKFDAHRVRKIGVDEMFIMSYGGLRGAVCFSLVALLEPKEFAMKDTYVTTTLVVILFTVFFQGATIKPLVNKLRVKLATDKTSSMYEELTEKVNDHMMAGIEEVLGQTGKFQLREKMHSFDNKFLRRWLLKNPQRDDEEELVQCYEKLVMKEHYKNLHLCGATTLPQLPTAIHGVDSSAMLLKLAGGKQEEDEDSSPAYWISVPTARASKSNDTVSTAEPSVRDFRKMMERHASMAVPRVIPKNMFDSRLKETRQRGIMQQLHNKRAWNNRLQRMNSIRQMPERALSWSDDCSDQCILRGQESRAHPTMKGRAVTVDLSPDKNPACSELSKTFNAKSLEDTVFEEEEPGENHEKNPLLAKEEDKNLLENQETEAEDRHLTRQNAITSDNIPMEELSRPKSEG